MLNLFYFCFHIYITESCDLLSDVTTASFELLCVSHDLTNIAVPTPSNHVLLVNVVDYFQVVM